MVFSRKQDPQPASQPTDLNEVRNREQSVIAHANQIKANAPTDSVIGNDLSIEGQTITIRCKGTLRVNGNIQADLHSQALEVGREGRITGSISADKVNVFGHVSGAIKGSSVILHATAEVDGDIHSNNLAIESGARFDGRSRKARDGDDISPQLEKPHNGTASGYHGATNGAGSAEPPHQPTTAAPASPFTTTASGHNHFAS